LLKLLILTHRWTVRLIVASSIAAFFVIAAVILTLRYWLLPDIETYRSDIEQTVGAAIGERIAIGSIQADWTGIHPHLILRNVRIFDKSGQAAVTLDKIENNLSWMTFLTGEVRFASIEIDQPRLGIRRDKNGTIYVASIPINQGPANSGVSDWLLHQSEVLIKNGFILWEDEKMGAPPLMLNQVNFALVNSGQHHLFGLHATPPADLSSPIDIRGNLYGKSLSEPKAWRGKLYARIDYADTATLEKWLPSPRELLGGKGAMRVWLDFTQEKPEAFTADVMLSKVRAKLGNSLPEIGMRTLRGRLGWKSVDGGYEIRTQKLALETDTGESIPPTDFLLRSVPAHGFSPEEGELSADSLEFDTLSRLSEYFPLPSKARETLASLAPHGELRDLQIKWNGEEHGSFLFPWQSPAGKKAGQLPPHYSVKGRFSNLGFSASGNIFKGISGLVDGDENGGSFSLDSRHPEFILPKIFETPVNLDILIAQAKWQNGKQGQTVTFDNLSFSNNSLAGNAFGSYTSANNYADITGRLTRADASQVWRYLPLAVATDARNWVKNAILGGEVGEVKMRLKGNLDNFPFANDKTGLFKTAFKVKNATLRYAPEWPEMTSLSADILFQGSRMEINAHQGALLGARLTSCQAIIPDLGNAVLHAEGDASGPTDEFLKVIDQSPVKQYINGFTEGMRSTGNGNLKIKLDIPLEKIEDTRVSGSYQFQDDTVTGPGMPDMAHLNGRLDFSESTLSTKNASAVILGGPAVINVSTGQDGSLKIIASGRINPDNIADRFARHFHGSAAWHGTISASKKKTDFLIESNLHGLSSDLPYPFSRNAADITPTRLEKKSLVPNGNLTTFSYGKIMAAQFVGATENGLSRIDRGTIYFDEGLPKELPETPGIWIVGSLKSLDADRWRDILDESSGGKSPFLLAGVDLDIDAFTFLGKHFGKLGVSAKQNDGDWQATISGDDIDGAIQWLPEGKGQLIAKLKKLVIPYTPPEKEAIESKAALAKVANRNLPALDITADSFVMKNKTMGHLELIALQQGNDWKIQKLRISNPDSTLTADGLWQGWAIHPRTNINVKLDVSRIGKFLTRFGYPDNIMRGKGSMEGSLSWAGSPQSIDYATLNGNIALKAKHGQFNKIDPGIGKLLGILSLQEIPRRITLDFRDIFSQGFAFETISSSLKISDGIAYTSDLRIEGPAAEVGMSGQVDLDKETQDLKIIVRPQLGGSFSVASSLLGGPVVGVATWVVGKVLQDPLDRLAAYEYNVTGSWTDPIVTKGAKKK